MALCLGVVTSGPAFAQTIVYTDDFETTPVTGWSVNNTEFDADYTRFLGRFDDSPTETSRSFALPTGTSRVDVEFDFYRFDSWDNTAQWGFDRLQVDVDGTQVFSLPFDSDQAARSGTNGTIDWAHTPLAAATNNAFNLANRPWYQDQPHRVTLTVNSPGTTLDLTLRTFLNQGGNDESGGFDNVTITAFVEPVINAVKTVEIEDLSANPSFAIPGHNAVYTISVTNTGGAMDADSLVVVDSLPEEVVLDTSATIQFSDSSSPASGLTCCTAAQIDYSDTVSGPPVFGYTPTSAFDEAVTYVRITPSGTLRDSTVNPTTFSFSFPTRIQ